MNDFLTWALDLDTLRFGAESVRIGFERPLPVWAWPGVGAAAIAFAVWSYSRLAAPGAARVLLAITRALLLIAIVALITGPQLVKTDESVERDWVIALVDRSESMTIADAPGQGRVEGLGITREEQLRDAIGRSWPMWSTLAEQRTVVWLGFDAGAYDLPVSGTPGVDGALDLGEPAGRRTSLSRALDQALRRAAARPLSSVVIFSDGRSIDEPSRAAIRRLQAEATPVHVVPLGSADPVGDLAIRRAEGPGVAFVNDIAPVTVDVESLGATAASGATVRLIDEATGLTLDEQRIEPGASDTTVTLTHRPEEAGMRTWIVELEPDSPDLIAGNNQVEVGVELIDRPLRALYVDGYPRWEQRYLKNLLIREKSVMSSNLLFSPTKRSSQEGDIEIDALPGSPEEWAEYDVVILGDVSPNVFSTKQLEDLREHVSIRGGGLLWIGGEGSTPDAWWGTALADLLPFSRGGAVSDPNRNALVQPTILADRFGVLQLSEDASEPWPAKLADRASGWSMLRWIQRIDPSAMKPTAEALALAVDDVTVAESAQMSANSTPLVLSMRFGAGTILYVATDEIWRWRYGRGEQLFERFWLQLVRMLGRVSLTKSGKSAILTAEPRRAVVDQSVYVSVEILDQALLELGLSSVTVRLERERRAGEAEAPAPIELRLTSEGQDGRRFGTTWAASEAGEWRIEGAEAALAGLGLSEQVEVTLPDDELRRPETNHALLAAIASETGGEVVPADELAGLPPKLPNRRVRLVNETTEALWDTPLALLVVILLLTLEWVGRRAVRLV